MACGTGILTEHIRSAVELPATIIATDLNETMLDYACHKTGALQYTGLVPEDAQSLPFEDNGFDAFACQFGIMFFPDIARAFSDFARTLKAGGMLAYNVWGSLESTPVAKIAHQTVQSFFDSDPPNFPKVPFDYSKIETNIALIRGAGLDIRGFETVSAAIERGSAADVTRGFIEGNPGILQIRERATVEP